MNLRRVWLLLLGLIASTTLRGAVEEIRDVGLVFHVMTNRYVEELASARQPVIQVLMDEQWVGLPCNWGGTSREFRYRGPSRLKIAVAFGEHSPQQHLDIRLVDGVDSLLLILIPVENSTFELFPLDISSRTVPSGGATMVNLSGVNLAVNIGNERRILNEGERWHILTGKTTPFHLKAQVAAEYNERWRLVYRGNYSVRPSDHTFMLVHRQNMRQGNIMVSRIPLQLGDNAPDRVAVP